jgi:imidazolonepropionase-like amidohydrolase
VKTIQKIPVFFLLPLIIFSLSSVSAADQPLLLKNAKIYTMGEQGVLEKGMILINDGKIEKIGEDIAFPSEAKVFDLVGKTIIPGMVCASSSLFLHERDLSYSGEESPDTDILEGVHYFDPSIPEILKYGVTTAYISPVSFRFIGGLGAVVKPRSGMKHVLPILKEKAALSFRLERLQDKKTSNVLRLTQYHRIRDQFKQAQDYRKEWEKYEKKLKEYEEKKKELEEQKEDKTEKKTEKEPKDIKKPQEPKKPKKDEAKEILLQAMEKKMPVRFVVHRPDSILQALRLGEEFGLKVILERCEEWPVLLPELERASVVLLSSPLLDYKKALIPGGEKGYGSSLLKINVSDLFDPEKASLSLVREHGNWLKLASSQIPFALVPPDHFPLSARFMRFYAAFLVSQGIDPDWALSAITSRAAGILGVEDSVGSLEEGKDADLVVLEGEPLNSLSTVDMVFVDGSIAWKKEK